MCFRVPELNEKVLNQMKYVISIVRQDRNVMLDAVHFVLEFEFLAFNERHVELLSAVSPGQVPPYICVVIPDNP